MDWLLCHLKDVMAESIPGIGFEVVDEVGASGTLGMLTLQ